VDDLPQIAVTALTQGSVYALIALGFSMIYASTGVLNFAQGEFATLGALLGYTLLVGADLPYVLAVVVVVAGVGAAGGIYGTAVVRPLQRRRASIDAIIVATIAASIIIRFGAAAIYGNGEFAVPTPLPNDPVSVAGAAIVPQSFLIVAAAVAVFLLTRAFFAKTRMGRTFKAAAADRDAATLMGIDHGRVTIAVIVVSAALTGLAGLLFAPLGFASAFIGLPLGFAGIVAAIVGGIGSPAGAIVGGLGIGAVEALSDSVLSGYGDVAIFVVLLIALLMRPSGLIPGRLAVREG
jgi:branched-chain amino acid transport system permease protein